MKLTLEIVQKHYRAEVDFFSMEDYIDYKRDQRINDNQPKINPTQECYFKLPQLAREQLLDEEHSFMRVKLYIQDILIGYINLSPDTENDEGGNGCVEFSQEDLPDSDYESDKKIQSPKNALHECYGSVCFELSIQRNNHEDKRYFSEQVKIGWSDRTEANLKKMIDYINDHEKNLLQIDKDSKGKKALGIYSAVYRESGIDLWSSNSHSEDRKRWCEWATYIQLAQEIADIYESEYGYFRTHPLTCIKKEINIGHVEQLSSISPSTLQYIPIHPELLQPVKSAKGIPIKGKMYQPQKTMFIQNTRSLDIYENRVILGFLRTVIRHLMYFQDEMEQLDESEGNSDYNADLTLIKSILSQILNKLMQLSRMYKDALPIHAADVRVKPHSSDVFLSVRQYKEIYKYIQKWFNDNMYDINDKELFMPLTRTSTLYERYFLTIMIQYFAKREGQNISDVTTKPYEQQSYRKYEYNPPVLKHIDNRDTLNETVPLNNWNYKNAEFNNIFQFKLSNTEEVTLYYQPVIYGFYSQPNEDYQQNTGIGLYRNNFMPYKMHVQLYEEEYNSNNFSVYTDIQQISNSIRTYNNNRYPENTTDIPNYTSDFLVKYIQNVINSSVYPDNQYYVPDFLIKYKNTEDECTKYMIFDTKFSSLNTVQNHELEDLVYKYIISLSSFDEYQYDRYNRRNNPITIYEHSPVRLCFTYGGQDEIEGSSHENHYETENSGHISNDNTDNGIEDFAYVNLLHIYATKGEEDIFKQLDYILRDFLKKGGR